MATSTRNLQLIAQAYENWDKTVKLQERTIIHRIFRVFAFLVAILILMLLLGSLIRNSFRRQSVDQRRLRHMRLIGELSVQVGGWALIRIGCRRQIVSATNEYRLERVRDWIDR